MKTRNRALLGLSFGLLVLFSTFVWAQETEPNDHFANASLVTLGELLDAAFSASDTVDVFKFDASVDRMYNLNSFGEVAVFNHRLIFADIFAAGDTTTSILGSDISGRYENAGFRLAGWVPPQTGTYYLRMSVSSQDVAGIDPSYQVRLAFGTELTTAAFHEPDNTAADAASQDMIPNTGQRVHGYLYNSYSDTAVTDINWNDQDLFKFWAKAGQFVEAETFPAGEPMWIRDTDTEISLLDSLGTVLADQDDKAAHPGDPWEDILGINNTFSRFPELGPLPYTGYYYMEVHSFYNSVTRTRNPADHHSSPGGGEYQLSVKTFSAGEIEPNNSFMSADQVDLGVLLPASFSASDTVDVFKFQASSDRMYNLNSFGDVAEFNHRLVFADIFSAEDTTTSILGSDISGRYENAGFRLSGWVPPQTGTYYLRLSVSSQDVAGIDPSYVVRLVYGTELTTAAFHEPDNTAADANTQDMIPTDGTPVHGYLYNSYSDTAVTDINWNDQDLFKFWAEAGQFIVAETFPADAPQWIRDTDTDMFLLDSLGNVLLEGGTGDDKAPHPGDPWEDILGINNTFSRYDQSIGGLPYTGYYFVEVHSFYNSVTRTRNPADHHNSPGGGEYLLTVELFEPQESEPNNTVENATMIVLESLMNATLSATDTVDVFRFHADSTRMYTLNSIAPSRDTELRFFGKMDLFFEDSPEVSILTAEPSLEYHRWGFRLTGWVPPRTGTYFLRYSAKEVPAAETAYQVRLAYGTPLAIAANTHEPDNTIAEAAALPEFPTDGTKIHGYLYNSFSDTSVTNVNWNDFDFYKIWAVVGQGIIAETFTAGPDSMIRDTDTEIFLLDSAGVATGLDNDDKVPTADDPWEDILGGINNTFSQLQGAPLPYTGWYYVRVNSFFNSITRGSNPVDGHKGPGGGEYLLQIRLDFPSSVEGDLVSGLPKTFALMQNYPNPFNPETTIRYELPKDSDIKIAIFNMLGQKVVTLLDENKPAGRYSIVWNGKNARGLAVSSGVYFYRMRTKDFVKSEKMVLLK